MGHYRKNFTNIVRLNLLLLCVVLTSCKSTLNVVGNFPTPVVNQMPFSIGVVLGPEFTNFQYIEAEEDRDEWDISVGKAQTQLFDVVLTAMFSDVATSQSLQEMPDKSIDLFFQPSLENFQYNVPNETKGKMYEVWLKYNLKVFDAQQQLLADWILTAYGKTPTAFLKSQEDGLNEAMVIALRDLGAGIALRFGHVPEINQWLKKKQEALQASIPPLKFNNPNINK